MPSRRHGRTQKSISDVEPAQSHSTNSSNLPSKSSISNSISTSPTQAQSQFDSKIPPKNWPHDIKYITAPALSPYLPLSHLKWLHRKPQSQSQPQSNTKSTSTPRTTTTSSISTDDTIPTIKLPLPPEELTSHVQIRVINDEKHPAHGQHGLFAARDLKPGDLAVPYFGYVHSSTETEQKEYEAQTFQKLSEVELGSTRDNVNESNGKNITDSSTNTNTISAVGTDEPPLIGSWDISSYDLNIHRSDTIELAIDAQLMGNEARFVNDYRGVPAYHPSEDPIDPQRSEKTRRMAKRRVKGWGDRDIKSENKDATSPQENIHGRRHEGEQEVIKESDHGVNGHIYDGDDYSDKSSYSYSYNHDQGFAIPNAEFRDVYFELPPAGTPSDDKQGDTDENKIDHGNINNNSNDNVNANTNSNSKVKVKVNSNINRNGNANIHNSEQITVPLSVQRPHRRPKHNHMRGIAIFVLPAGKAGKRKHGIKTGQEILVSYGKGFWAHRS